MYLKQLSILNFKNYLDAVLSFSPRINCFAGNNGVGKTNILDAIYYLSLTKSYFNPVDSQNINYAQEFFVLEGSYDLSGNTEDIFCGVQRNQGKKFKRNNKEYTKISEHIGLIPVVMISPGDSELISGGSELRRRYIDSVISQYNRLYLENLLRYNHVLQQRNTYLKMAAKTGFYDADMIEMFDIQLVKHGNYIFGERELFFSRLQPVFDSYYVFLSQGAEKVELKYNSQLYSASFEELLAQTIEKDRILQYTSSGIHKDDLSMEIFGLPIKKNGSQGQQKTLLVALKLAQYQFFHQVRGVFPILLLDDIFDKLDENRVLQIIKIVSDLAEGQIFITDTHPQRLKNMLADLDVDNIVYFIENNTFTAI